MPALIADTSTIETSSTGTAQNTPTTIKATDSSSSETTMNNSTIVDINYMAATSQAGQSVDLSELSTPVFVDKNMGDLPNMATASSTSLNTTVSEKISRCLSYVNTALDALKSERPIYKKVDALSDDAHHAVDVIKGLKTAYNQIIDSLTAMKESFEQILSQNSFSDSTFGLIVGHSVAISDAVNAKKDLVTAVTNHKKLGNALEYLDAVDLLPLQIQQIAASIEAEQSKTRLAAVEQAVADSALDPRQVQVDLSKIEQIREAQINEVLKPYQETGSLEATLKQISSLGGYLRAEGLRAFLGNIASFGAKRAELIGSVSQRLEQLKKPESPMVQNTREELVKKFSGYRFELNNDTPKALELASVPVAKATKDLSRSYLSQGLSDANPTVKLNAADIKIIRENEAIILKPGRPGMSVVYLVDAQGKEIKLGKAWNDDALAIAKKFKDEGSTSLRLIKPKHYQERVIADPEDRARVA